MIPTGALDSEIEIAELMIAFAHVCEEFISRCGCKTVMNGVGIVHAEGDLFGECQACKASWKWCQP